MADIFKKQRLYDSLNTKSNWNWKREDNSSNIKNQSFQRNISSIYGSVTPTNNQSIKDVETRLSEFKDNYNKDNNWNETTLMHYQQAIDGLDQFKNENIRFKNDFDAIMQKDDDLKSKLLGVYDEETGKKDPSADLLTLPQEEFEEKIRYNKHRFLDDLHKDKMLFYEFEMKYPNRISNSTTIKQGVYNTYDTMNMWKNAIESELQSVLGLKPSEFQNIIENPELYEQYYNSKIKEYDGVRRGIQKKLDTLYPEFTTRLNNFKSGSMWKKVGQENQYVPMNAPEIEQNKNEMYRLQTEARKLNYAWGQSHYFPPDNPVYLDFEVDGKEYQEIDKIIALIKSDENDKKQFINDPIAYVKSKGLKKGSEVDIAQSLGLAPNFANIDKQEPVGDIVMASNKKEEKEVIEDEEEEKVVEDDKEEDKKKKDEVLLYDKEEGFTPAANEYDINAIQKELKKGENVVYINSKNSSEISLEPKKGYNKSTLTKQKIIQRMKAFNNSLRSKNNITLKKALNDTRSMLNDPNIRKSIIGDKSSINQAMAEEIKEFNNQNPDMSFLEWLGKKYNVSQNLTQNK